MPEISKRSMVKLLKQHAPGAYTPEATTKAIEITEDIIRQIAKHARELTELQNKKRVTDKEIKIAAKYLTKQEI